MNTEDVSFRFKAVHERQCHAWQNPGVRASAR
jgi:hypothetical protein